MAHPECLFASLRKFQTTVFYMFFVTGVSLFDTNSSTILVQSTIDQTGV